MSHIKHDTHLNPTRERGRAHIDEQNKMKFLEMLNAFLSIKIIIYDQRQPNLAHASGYDDDLFPASFVQDFCNKILKSHLLSTNNNIIPIRIK